MSILDSFKDVFSDNELENKKIDEHKFRKILRKMIYNKGIVHYLNSIQDEHPLSEELWYYFEDRLEDVSIDVYPDKRLIIFNIYDDKSNLNEGTCLQFHKNYFSQNNKVRNINIKNDIVDKMMSEYRFKTYKDLITLESNKKDFQKRVEDISDHEFKMYLKEKIEKKILRHESLEFKEEKYNVEFKSCDEE